MERLVFFIEHRINDSFFSYLYMCMPCELVNSNTFKTTHNGGIVERMTKGVHDIKTNLIVSIINPDNSRRWYKRADDVTGEWYLASYRGGVVNKDKLRALGYFYDS